ncbi:uncharacterized protein [Amphiura filiformis]|uniref:uncharacterized protein isoform X2 n=1 Tax=Amphiura filiformis TaxID=82378 RepID=UPI003B226AE6
MTTHWILLPMIAGVCLSASIQHPSSKQPSNIESEATTYSTGLPSTMDKNSPKTSSILIKLGIHSSETTNQDTDNDNELTTRNYPRRIRRSSACKRHSDDPCQKY